MVKNIEESKLIRKNYVSELRKLRQAKNVSLNVVSDATGISKQTLHNWENGTIKNIGPKYQEEANKLAKFYGISRKQLDLAIHQSWFDFKSQTSKYQTSVKNKTYLYEWRMSQYKTLQNVADSCGTTIYKINAYELGTQTPNEEEIKKLAKCFKVDTSDITSKLEK